MLNQKTSYGLALLSGFLILLSFPPFRFGGILAWFALVPFLIAIHYESTTKTAKRLSQVAGVGCIPIMIWFAWWFQGLVPESLSIPVFIAGLVFSILCAIGWHTAYVKDYWKPKDLPSRKLSYLPSLSRIFIIPLMLTSIEYLYLNIPGVMRISGIAGFMSIAKTQWFNPAILHLASFTGMYGVTFLILLVNCAIAYTIIHYKENREIFKVGITVLVLFAMIFSYGLLNIPSIEEGDVTVTIIQTPPIEGEDINDLYSRLSKESLKYDPQIIVWPFLLSEGLNPGGTPRLSSNLAYHMVTLPQNIIDKDIKAIFFPEVQILDTEMGNFGIVVCIESGSTLPTRDIVKAGAQFLVVPTVSPNAYVFSWALGTNAVYRAVEHKIFAVEVIGDHDSSIIIDPYGRILEDLAPEPEIVAGKISFTDNRTFYTRYGDVFGWIVIGLTAVLYGYEYHLKIKSPFKYCVKCGAKIEKDAKTCPECGIDQPSALKRFLFHQRYE